MKYMIASDIHGSSKYCSKLIDAFEMSHSDMLILLGDILYHGPRNDLPEEYSPKTVIAMLNDMSEKLLCVRGNCDSEVDQMVLDFPIMADYAVVSDNGKRRIYMTHGDIYMDLTICRIYIREMLCLAVTHIFRCMKLEMVFFVLIRALFQFLKMDRIIVILFLKMKISNFYHLNKEF